jgi:anti-anti-sigma factor
MNFESIRKDKAAIFVLKGDLDFHSYRDLKESIEKALDARLSPVVLDMEGVTHVDSMGLGTLTKLWKKAHEGGQSFYLASCSKNVEKMIHLVNLDNRIRLFPNTEDALAN